MKPGPDITAEQVDRACRRLREDAERYGYRLNPDDSFTVELVRSLLVNEGRYGYRACPCRLASGVRREDRDIICPCDYRDSDLAEYHACYCGLYVSEQIARGERSLEPVPERRPPEEERMKEAEASAGPAPSGLSLPVWRCKVCGYLCAREEPPGTCPICKADKDRFERFM
jgi:ferredoxin-thioredoxin reductase catalytic chain